MSDQKSLMKLVEDSKSIETMLLESGGEITPEIENCLLITETNLPEKIDSYSLIMDRFDSISKFYKDKAEFFTRMAKTFANAERRLKDNLEAAMNTLGTDELQGFDVRFKLQASKPSVIIENEETIDKSYTTIEQVVKINKDRIRQDLELGVPVAGARLERGFSLRTYANTPAKKTKAVKA